MKYSTLLFDIDNTLLDSAQSEYVALKKVLEPAGVSVDERFAEEYRKINRAYWASFNSGLIDRKTVFKGRIKELFDLYGLNLDPEKYSILFLEAFAESGIAMKGAEETLRSLKDEGFVLYVASNGVLTIQEKRMDLAGLYPYFTGFFVSDVIGCNKPNPGFFEYILDRIGERDKSRILMTGDEVIADISGTLKIGLKACLFRKKTDTELERDFKNEYPDVPIIHSLAEIRRIAGEENQKG